MKLPLLAAGMFLAGLASGLPAAEPAAELRIQLAILLDTSSSMQGLINQARTQLWKIVNEFIGARQDGRTPHVEVALYEYGRNSLAAEKHWVRQVQPLTRDLDRISEELFRLNISASGCEEYPGAAIKDAVGNLAWDPSPKIYKAIFVAGNESFTQGPVDPVASCREAIGRGIIVNTIHCGTEADGRLGQWDVAAKLADGQFLNIDQNQTVAAVAAPQDAEITRLNEQLNQTYLWYGSDAQGAATRQAAQDGNAAAVPGAVVERAATKATANYFLAHADLVDKAKEPGFDLAAIRKEDLPRHMQGMTAEEKRAHIDEKSGERRKLQQQILELSKARSVYLAEKALEQGKDTLDSAVRKAVRDQAAKKQISWEK